MTFLFLLFFNIFIFNAINTTISSLNSNLANTNNGNVNTWNDNIIKINNYNYIETVSGVYINVAFCCLEIIKSGTNTPFIVITQQLGKSFYTVYGNVINRNGLVYTHTGYDYAFMLTAYEDFNTGEEYYCSMFLPYAYC